MKKPTLRRILVVLCILIPALSVGSVVSAQDDCCITGGGPIPDLRFP
jgi:hypothetical protein